VPTGLPDMNFGAVGMASVEYEHLVMWWIHWQPIQHNHNYLPLDHKELSTNQNNWKSEPIGN
jgi:hypothetical protein